MSVKSNMKPASAAKKRQLQATVHRWVRYGIQLVFFILAPGLFSGAFNGVKYLCTQIGLGDAIEPTSFLIQLIAVLAFTILFGRFFCGYACAFGALGDYLYNAFEFLRKRTPIPRPQFPLGLVRVLSLLKYVVLAGIGVACFVGVWADYSSYSPWVAFAAILAGTLDGIEWVAWLLLGLVVLGMILRERFFCQFLCPLGAVFALMPVLGCSEFVRTRAHCAKKCDR
ncbi:MAG: 4Fe-4S binding protein, partial [Eggerthellaceae bacterium]|nr:4Fe-4S binding protein [Eggerthellaceae bacterium]